MAVRGRSMVVTSCVAAALTLTIPAAATAGPPDQSGVVERMPAFSAPLFWDGELIVLVGPPLEQGCVEWGFHFPTATTVVTPGGDTITRYTDIDTVWVFDDEDVAHPFDWLIGRACSAVWAGKPVPEPLAHGEGRVIYNTRVDADGDLHGNQRFTGQVTTADGRQAHLSAVGAGIGEFPDAINYGG
jgi:hypothetical protein